MSDDDGDFEIEMQPGPWAFMGIQLVVNRGAGKDMAPAAAGCVICGQRWKPEDRTVLLCVQADDREQQDGGCQHVTGWQFIHEGCRLPE